MLTRFHKILIAALAVQLVLAVIVLTRGDDSAALKEHPIIAGFDAAKVTELKVSGKPAGATDAAKPDAGKPIDLVKRDKDWVLASGFDFPVEQKKVDDVLSPIAKLSAAAPIATQAARHKQLHVADDDFERKLVISAGGKDITLFVGGSAGARRTAVRLGGDDKVYAVTGLNAYSIGSEPRLWIDTAYVKIPRDDIAKLVVHSGDKKVEMTKAAPPPPPAAGSGSAAGSATGAGSGSAAGSAAPPAPPAAEHWSATIGGEPIALAGGETLDETAFDRLVGDVATLDLSAPADPKRDASRPTATITIERKATGAASAAPTVIDVVADGTSYWVHDRSQPRAGLVDKARLDEVIAVDRDKLVKKPPPPAPKPGAGSGSAAGTGYAAPGMPGPVPGHGSASPPGKGAAPPAGGW
ncbi:MAG TPA: DUF4340 domain-containing protein [Kofleriaceae bacterium]|jgi:hypothetical protein|nr:DUF4340 domain-containing protein [Kofleriaceae bacterium]